jgi:transcriptional regulator GlxA family with amidase domain
VESTLPDLALMVLTSSIGPLRLATRVAGNRTASIAGINVIIKPGQVAVMTDNSMLVNVCRQRPSCRCRKVRFGVLSLSRFTFGVSTAIVRC